MKRNNQLEFVELVNRFKSLQVYIFTSLKVYRFTSQQACKLTSKQRKCYRGGLFDEEK
jgi:hypothetical protein